jgi:hypothetical protein
MPSIINASSTGSGGIVQTADASGVLQLQSNGVTALSTSGANVTIAGTLTTAAQSIARASLPAGSVLQVVNSIRTAGDATTSVTFVATGLSASITPTSATSKILIICTAPLYNAGDNFHQYNTIYRGGSNLVANEMQLFSAAGSVSGRWTNGAMTYLDSPSTTSSTTYTVYFRSLTAGNEVNYGTAGQPSVMTLMEISA